MYIIRSITTIATFLFAVLVSYLSGTGLFEVLSLMSFVLVVDTVTVRILANIYLRSVYEEMEKTQIEKRKSEKNDLSP